MSIFKLAASRLLFYGSYAGKIRSTIVSKGMCQMQLESLCIQLTAALKLAAFSHSSLCDSTASVWVDSQGWGQLCTSRSVYNDIF